MVYIKKASELLSNYALYHNEDRQTEANLILRNYALCPCVTKKTGNLSLI
jgi:hypothetical protein